MGQVNSFADFEEEFGLNKKIFSLKDKRAAAVFCELPANAGKRKSWLLYTSLGIGNQLINFLDALERIQIQLANRFFYDHAIGRIETQLQLLESKRRIFTWGTIA